MAEIIASCQAKPRSLKDGLGQRYKARSHPPYTASSPTIKRDCVVVHREDICSSSFIVVLRTLMELVTLATSPPKMATSKRTEDGRFVVSGAAETMNTEEIGLSSVTLESGPIWGQGDRDSQRKRLLNGAMKLLLELMKDQAETKAGKCTGRGVGKDCNDLVWVRPLSKYKLRSFSHCLHDIRNMHPFAVKPPPLQAIAMTDKSFNGPCLQILPHLRPTNHFLGNPITTGHTRRCPL